MRTVSVCCRCGKRAIHENNYIVEVKIDGKREEDITYMVCICDNCGERYVVEVK